MGIMTELINGLSFFLPLLYFSETNILIELCHSPVTNKKKFYFQSSVAHSELKLRCRRAPGDDERRRGGVEMLKLTQLCLFGFEAGKLHMSKTSLIASTFLLRSGGEVGSTRFSRSIRKVLSLPILPIRAHHQTRIKATKTQHYIEKHTFEHECAQELYKSQWD